VWVQKNKQTHTHFLENNFSACPQLAFTQENYEKGKSLSIFTTVHLNFIDLTLVTGLLTGLSGSSSSLDSSEELSSTGLVTFLLCGGLEVFSTGCCFFLEGVMITGAFCSSELSLVLSSSDELSSFISTVLDLAAATTLAYNYCEHIFLLFTPYIYANKISLSPYTIKASVPQVVLMLVLIRQLKLVPQRLQGQGVLKFSNSLTRNGLMDIPQSDSWYGIITCNHMHADPLQN